MGKKKKQKKTRAEPNKTVSYLCSAQAYEDLCCTGYTRLSQNPEIMAGVGKICDLVSSMTIHLMENTDQGDVRIRNELSKKIDINPNPNMTRKSFIYALTRTLLLEGDGNAVVYPKSRDGLLESLNLVPYGHVSFASYGMFEYKILIDGVPYDSDEVMHFVINPDPELPWKGCGYRAVLKDVAGNLKQAAATKKGFMESKWKPSIIVKVDSMTDEFASKEGRKKLLNTYLESSEAGEPWMIPADQFDIKEVRPLSLNDLAISDAVMLDKKTVAAILDIPPYLVGAGEFREAEWNNFVNTRIRGICMVIEQVMTRGLLLNPRWYFRFSVRSLYSYDIEKLSKVGDDNYTRGIMSGNEVRDWLGLSPKEGLDDLIILENYIPQGMIGEQKKLTGGEGDGE